MDDDGDLAYWTGDDEFCGKDLADQRAASRCKRAKYIMVTGSGHVVTFHDRERAHRLIADAYLLKFEIHKANVHLFMATLCSKICATPERAQEYLELLDMYNKSNATIRSK